MSDEFSKWDALARLWHSHTETMLASDIERHARWQRNQMRVLAAGEAVGMALSFGAVVWIAMQTAMVELTAISMVFFGVCAFVQHRLRREPPANGGFDLLSSLDHSIARENWNLTQFAIGRTVTFFTLFGIAMVAADHALSNTGPPAARLGVLLAVTLFVLAVLALNIDLTRRARTRKRRMADFAMRMRVGPEFRNDGAQ